MAKNNYQKAKDFLKNSTDLTTVADGMNYWVKYLLSLCYGLFVYRNLPETLPAWEIEKNLIMKGNGTIIKKGGNLYIPFEANAYGQQDSPYFIPTKAIYANPKLGGGQIKDGVNGVIIWNTDVDKMTGGSILWETIQRYARALADLESSFANQTVSTRAGLLAEAGDMATAQAMDQVITKLQAGTVATVVNNKKMFDTLGMFNLNTNVSFTTYTETRDYLLNCFMNSIGLQTIEEKKERMIEAEVENNQENDVLSNNINRMFKCRCENVDKINNLFGTKIEVYRSKLVG